MEIHQPDSLQCDQNCINDECVSLTCYVLDNNAYVILSFEPDDTGKWFGDIRPNIMKMLVQERVYKSVRMYDYQAVCFPVEGGETNDATTFFSVRKLPFYRKCTGCFSRISIPRAVTSLPLFFIRSDGDKRYTRCGY